MTGSKESTRPTGARRTTCPIPEPGPSTAATSTSSPVRNCPTARFTTPARFASPRSPTGSATPRVSARRSWATTSTTNPGSSPPSDSRRQFALFNETTITNLPAALVSCRRTRSFRPVSHRTHGRATGAANGRAAASSWRRITISTRRTASIRIAPTAAGTRR